MDRYFLSVPALKTIAEEAIKNGASYITLITLAKGSPAAYEKPKPRKGPGRRAKRGKKVHPREYSG
jgi:hypothetical protein